MGKRSSFERNPNDFYPTPFAAAAPLIPHLRGIRTFAEPCAGDGALVRHLESFGLRAVYAGDIVTGQDALALQDYGGPDAIITNPPYEWKVLRKLIPHFMAIAPTWLLLQLNFTANQRTSAFMEACTDIVHVGRLRLIPGTPSSGQENHSWLRFSADHTGGPILHPRKSLPVSRRTRICTDSSCGKPYRPQRSDTRFCSDACRQRAYRERAKCNGGVTA